MKTVNSASPYRTELLYAWSTEFSCIFSSASLCRKPCVNPLLALSLMYFYLVTTTLNFVQHLSFLHLLPSPPTLQTKHFSSLALPLSMSDLWNLCFSVVPGTSATATLTADLSIIPSKLFSAPYQPVKRQAHCQAATETVIAVSLHDPKYILVSIKCYHSIFIHFYRQVLLSLRALGNLGMTSEVSSTLNRCLMSIYAPLEVKVTAAEAFRRVPCKARKVKSCNGILLLSAVVKFYLAFPLR